MSEPSKMVRVCADFNTRSSDGLYVSLRYNEIDLELQIEELGLSPGDKIILYPDEDDFDVIAELDFRCVDLLERATWVAIPDWSTIVRKT